jgi:predicted ATP-grasp superfamily ATP-dependent carboligase
MIKQIIILGNHIQALGICRIVGKMGYPVVLFNSYNQSVTRYSKYCTEFVLFSSHADLLLKLEKRGSSDKSTLLIPTNDDLVGFIRNHYAILESKYFLSTPNPEVIDICFNKKNTYLKAEELGIDIPKSYFPNNKEELLSIADKLIYPVILKPAVMFTFFQATGKKAFKCTNYQELIANYTLMQKYIPGNEIIVQEFLSGGAKNLYSYGSFFANKVSYANFVVNRIRQKPMDFGISTCFAKTVINQQIQLSAEKFLQGINYFGISEVEFMYDPEQQTYKLLEINPRSWKWHTITNLLDINLFQLLIDYLEGKKLTLHVNDKENIAWIEHLTDTFIVMSEMTKGHLSLKEYLATLKLNKESACLSKDDPMPALMYLLLAPYLLYKR